MSNRIDIAKPAIGEEEVALVAETLRSGWLTQGPKVAQFEKDFSKQHQVQYALATTSCTTALHLALVALGIGPGDEVIVPAFTWIATANVVEYCGAKPVFCDVDPHTFNIDCEKIPQLLTDRTKAVIPVHLFGLCADIDTLRGKLPRDVKIVEDAACAAGATYKGIPAGGLGDIAAFSFHPRKSITTGEGGMLTCHDERLYQIANILRNHGAEISEEQRHHSDNPFILPEFNVLGYNYRLTDIQAAVGIVQLRKLEKIISERERAAINYNNALAGLSWIKPQAIRHDMRSARQAYVCVMDPEHSPISRNQLMQVLKENNIHTRPGTHAVHKQNYYRKRYNLKNSDFPVADYLDEQTIALPLHNQMSASDYNDVIEQICGIEETV